jgi:hypothetical protein
MKTVRRIAVIILILLILLLLLQNIKLSNTLISRSNEQSNQIHHLEQEVAQVHNQIATLPKKHTLQAKTNTAVHAETPNVRTAIIATLAYLGAYFKNISIFSLTSK